MSNQTNDQLLDRAAEMVDYFESKLPAQLILKALDSNDLELVRKYTLEAEAEASRQEIYGYDLMPEQGDN